MTHVLDGFGPTEDLFDAFALVDGDGVARSGGDGSRADVTNHSYDGDGVARSGGDGIRYGGASS